MSLINLIIADQFNPPHSRPHSGLEEHRKGKDGRVVLWHLQSAISSLFLSFKKTKLI